MERVEKQLNRVDGPLVKQLRKLGSTPQEILDEACLLHLERKILAHEFLPSYIFERNLDTVNHREQVALLEDA